MEHQLYVAGALRNKVGKSLNPLLGLLIQVQQIMSHDIACFIDMTLHSSHEKNVLLGDDRNLEIEGEGKSRGRPS